MRISQTSGSQMINCRYFCPREGWGYPSNGENEVTIYCQHDGSWSNDANIETCMSNFQKMIYRHNKFNN